MMSMKGQKVNTEGGMEPYYGGIIVGNFKEIWTCCCLYLGLLNGGMT